MAELVLLWLRKNWLTLLLCAIMFAGYKYHQYLVKEAHESGYEDGKKATEQIAESREKKLLEQRLADKNALEQKQQAELALRDNRILELDNAADGMRTELERIARLAGHYTGVKSSGDSARKAVGLLAELLRESQDAYRATAAEADRYYLAGMTCQQQYNSLRGNYEAKTTEGGSQTYVKLNDR